MASRRNGLAAGGLCATALALALALGPVEAAAADTLRDALVQAYSGNPTLLSARAQLRATDENVPQALSGWRPTVTVTGTGGASESRVSTAPEQSLLPWFVQAELNQPLYRGGRTQAQTRAAEAQVMAAREQVRGQERDVLLAAVTAYLDVLRDTARVDLTRNNEIVLRRQLEATQDRFEVGEVTRTDVAQAEARLSGAVSARAAAEGDLQVSRATYQRVVGVAPGTLEAAPPLPPLPATLPEAVAAATGENPDVLAAQFVEEQTKHNVRVAEGALYPTVSLIARSVRSDEQTLEDVRNRADSLLAQVVVPLYQGGTVYSQVRQAKEVNNQRRIDIETARRRVVELVTQAWERLMATRATIVSRTEQVRASAIALDGVQQEAAVGARTTLDVLDAEQELLDARVALVVADRDEYVAGFNLLAAIGRLSAQQLALPVAYYDPEAHYRNVRDQWYGTAPRGE